MLIKEMQSNPPKTINTQETEHQARLSPDTPHFHIDQLTGLLLYSSFQKACTTLYTQSSSTNPLLFLFIDADNLKQENDSLGHEAGDQMIVKIANLIANNLPNNAIMCRKGGDEFVVALECTDIVQAKKVPQQLHASFSGCHQIAGHETILSCSIGAAIETGPRVDLKQHEKHADIAMYWAKKCGKNQLKFYCEDDCKEISMQRCLSFQLPNALHEHDLSLAFQPIYRIADRYILGAEALIRWQHPEYGMIPAPQIIEAATHSGKLLLLGLFVLRKACEAAKSWPSQRYVSINFAASDFLHISLAQNVLEVLASVGFSPARLRIEITEAEMLELNDIVRSNINLLRKHGIKIGIDDFGTGYSSMGSIDSFPVDFLKIDKSLVSGCENRFSSKTFLRAIKSVAERIGLEVIAEGVETLSEGAVVRGCGISAAQGFYFCRPTTPPELLKLFQRPLEDVYLKV